MAFPQTRLPVMVELDLAGDGTFSTDITSKVRVQEGIVITRGRPNETSTAEPATCALTLDNRDGRFSLRKPDGPYYGQLRRNTPLRVSITAASSWLQITAATGTTPAAGARVTTPDSAALGITGDIDVRFDADLDSWWQVADILGKWTGTAGVKSWQFLIHLDGRIGLYWSTNGTNELGFVSTDPVPKTTGRLAVRATLDVDNGAAGHTVTFYTSDTIGGSWTQLGDARVGTGTTSIFDSTAEVSVLDSATGSQGSVIHGRVYGARVYQGIAGTLRASPDFTAQTHGASSFADAQGNTWTLTGAVALSTRDVRFVGEVPSWPVTWDLSQRNVYTTIEATGVLRRLMTGATALQSPLYRANVADDTVLAYWPCEDGVDAEFLAPAVGSIPMRFKGSPTLASYEGFDASAPLPVLDATTELRAGVPRYTATGEIQARCVMFVPAAGVTNGQTLFMVGTTGTAHSWQVRYGTGGTLSVLAFDDTSTILSDGPTSFDVNGMLFRLSIELTQNGGDVDWQVGVWEVGTSAAASASGTVNTQTIGRANRVVVSPFGGTDQLVAGHVAVHSEVTSIFDDGDDLKAFVGETAHDRIKRLCGEVGVAFAGQGPADGTPMGPQRPGLLVDLIREAEEADGGILFEPRDQLGIAYRPRSSMFAQEARVTLDYDGRHLQALQPIEDDDATRNDITVTRIGGASFRATLDDGALSTLDPPDGVGRYATDYSLNLQDDRVLGDHAHWRLNVGTVDEARYPQIGVNLAAAAVAADSSLTMAVRDLDVGDRLAVTDPPSTMLPPDDISQLAVGFTEVLGPKAHAITANCAPESPYHVGVYEGDTGAAESRYSAVGTVTAEALDTTETGVDITAPAGHPGWAHNDGNYQIVIGGEVMTVTAVSGTAPTQTLTVTRSVNGIVKSHSTGADVALARPVMYG